MNPFDAYLSNLIQIIFFDIEMNIFNNSNYLTTNTSKPKSPSEDDDDDFFVPPAANASSCTPKEVLMYDPVRILLQLFNLIKCYSEWIDYMLLITDIV